MTVCKDFYVAKIPKIGEKVQVRLQSGNEVVGVVRAIFSTNSGPRLRMEYGSEGFVATVNVDQVIWPFEAGTGFSADR
jgi:hypothetical protein